MLRHNLVIGLACVGLAACQPSMTRQERAVEEQVIRDQLTAWTRAFSNRQQDSLAMFYHQSPDLTVAWPDGHRSSGWEEEEQAQRVFFSKVGQVNFVVQDVRVQVFSPTLAQATFRHASDVIMGDLNPERQYFTGSGTMIWMKPDPRGNWVIHTEQVSETPAAAPPPAAPARRR
ncbi:MAG: nuclear transport factor 2 family protein [Gemmatimonadota bacterium]|nr:nuclear transport factor 2 family protein [Gemmatimonadota bacterium]